MDNKILLENIPVVKDISYDEKKDILTINGVAMNDYHLMMINKSLKDKIGESFTNDEITEALKEITAKKESTQEKTEQKENKHREYNWRHQLRYTEKGDLIKSIQNVEIFMQNDRRFKGKFSYNEFTKLENYDGEPIKDFNISQWRVICEEEIGINTKDLIETAVQDLAHKSSFHPFTEKINNLKWDGEERMATYFIKFLGAEDNEMNREMTVKWFYALIKRLYEPGCPFDNMLIAYDSKQGTGKSKLVERIPQALGINYGYCSTISCDNIDKDNVDKMNRTWIVGIDEMTEFLKANPEKTKQFLSQSSDVARLSYGKRSETFNRHCVFYGTTNVEYFLKDYTSEFERRYWVLECDGDNRRDSSWWKENLTDEYIRQVIAEAYYMYRTQPNFEYMTLSIDTIEYLKQIQYKHKTLQNDDVLIKKLEILLNTYYDRTEFRCLEELESTIQNAMYHDLTDVQPTNQFLGVEEPDSRYNQISRIPTTLLKEYVKKYIGRDLSTQYISALLWGKWEKKTAKYIGKATNCFVRI